jgi:hypothetical protein
MPWTINENGERDYKVSSYCKEELPTWGELYNRFYVNLDDLVRYDPDNKNQQTLDIYWKIPARKMLLALVCNQINKMIFEDGMRDDVLEWINQNIRKSATDIRFSLPIITYDNTISSFQEKWEEFSNLYKIGTTMIPPIYYIPSPSGKPNPFQISSVKRININSLDTVLHLTPIIQYRLSDRIFDTFILNYYSDEHNVLYKKLLKFIFNDVIHYFEDPIGWKDASGSPIGSYEPIRNCNGVGMDPAL